MGEKNQKNVIQTDAWRRAEFDYAGVVASAIVPFFCESLTQAEVDERMASFLDAAFEQMTELLEGEELIDTVDELVEGLEERLRYDLCCRYLEKLVEMYPDQALYYDYWAGSELRSRNGSVEKARELQRKALQLAPNNPTFCNNLGWIHLTAGEQRSWISCCAP